MRIPLRTKVTLTLVAFGLIPAGIVAAFAYMSAQDFMGRQSLLIRQAAAAISDHAKMLVFKNNELEKGKKPENEHKSDIVTPESPQPFKWLLTDADREDLQRYISTTLEAYKLSNAVVSLSIRPIIWSCSAPIPAISREEAIPGVRQVCGTCECENRH